MLIQGLWFLCDDGMVRPVLKGEVLSASGEWNKFLILADTGADRTVFSADVLAFFPLLPQAAKLELGGIGGNAAIVEFETQIRFETDDHTKICFKGRYAAFTQVQSLDMTVLGRDILNHFALIVDRPQDTVCLLSQRHRYRIEQS